MTTAAVRYHLVITGICLYHSSTAWAIVAIQFQFSGGGIENLKGFGFLFFVLRNKEEEDDGEFEGDAKTEMTRHSGFAGE